MGKCLIGLHNICFVALWALCFSLGFFFSVVHFKDVYGLEYRFTQNVFF